PPRLWTRFPGPTDSTPYRGAKIVVPYLLHAPFPSARHRSWPHESPATRDCHCTMLAPALKTRRGRSAGSSGRNLHRTVEPARAGHPARRSGPFVDGCSPTARGRCCSQDIGRSAWPRTSRHAGSNRWSFPASTATAPGYRSYLYGGSELKKAQYTARVTIG